MDPVHRWGMNRSRWFAAMVAALLLTRSSPSLATPPPPPPPDDADDTHIIAFNTNPASRYPNCQYASAGDIVVNIPVARYVGATDANGYLLDVATLVSRGVVSATAHLRMPAGDIDFNTLPPSDGRPNERDRVLFNGHDLGYLHGAQQIWEYNDFTIPIEWVRFGSIGSPATNELRIQIDVLHEGFWCMSLDWVRLSFQAMAPIVFVHGIHPAPAMWSSFASKLSQMEIPYNSGISLDPDGTIRGNASLLAGQLSSVLSAYGTNKCHIVAHSKGGLDTWMCLGLGLVPGLKVESVTTLSTPYHGSVLSQLQKIAIQNTTGRFASDNPDLLQLLVAGVYLHALGVVADRPGVDDLQPHVTDGILAQAVPSGLTTWYSAGADADLDNDGDIGFLEAYPLNSYFGIPVPGADGIANLAYHTLGNAAELNSTLTTINGGAEYWDLVTVKTPNQGFLLNDIAVTASSAHCPIGTSLGILDKNHGSIYTGQDVLDLILGNLQNQFPLPAVD